jgi:serine/threonine protein kinase
MSASKHGPDPDDTQPLPSRPPPRHPATEARPSDLLGRYRIVGEAGKGGMGTVCEAVDTLLNRRVAIKFLSVFIGEAARERMIHEARAMAGLRHRSICRVIEVVLDPPSGTSRDSWRPFLVSGLLATADLVLRGFYRIDRNFEGSPTARLGMMLGLAAVGIVAMFLASYPERVARGVSGMLRGFTTQFSRRI